MKSDHQYLNLVLVSAVIYGLVVSYIGGQLVVAYRKINVRLLKAVYQEIERGHITVINIIPFISILMHYIMMLSLIISALFLGDWLFPHLHKLPVEWDVYFRYGVIGILGIGAGLVLTLYQEKDASRYLAIGIALGACIFYFING